MPTAEDNTVERRDNSALIQSVATETANLVVCEVKKENREMLCTTFELLGFGDIENEKHRHEVRQDMQRLRRKRKKSEQIDAWISRSLVVGIIGVLLVTTQDLALEAMRAVKNFWTKP